MASKLRYFKNPLINLGPNIPPPKPLEDLPQTFQNALEHIIHEQIAPQLVAAQFPRASPRHQRALDVWDRGSVYIGFGGIALLYIQMAKQAATHVRKDQPASQSAESSDASSAIRDYLQQAQSLLSQADERIHRDHIGSFLEGKAGCYALQAVAAHLAGDASDTQGSVHRLCHLWDEPGLTGLPSGECELLYGRAGYLYALLFVAKNINLKDIVPTHLVEAVVNAIVEEGKKNAADGGPFPLTYYWHDSLYLGAAHGIAGILMVLLQARELFPSAVSDDDLNVILETLDKLLDTRTDDGNFPSSYGKEKADKVQWCHGAPGFIPLLMKAAQHSDPNRAHRYHAAAAHATELVWNHGLLRKGVGLCHGISGNGLVLLAMHRETGEKEYLHRAQQFALFALRHQRELEQVPDRPYSLYEGLGGLAALLMGLQAPEMASFPGYEL